MYFNEELEKNHIGDLGCKYLRSTKWPILKTLILGTYFIYTGENDIGPLGCEYLSLCEWPLLTEFVLGNQH